MRKAARRLLPISLQLNPARSPAEMHALAWLILIPVALWEAFAWRFGLPSISVFAREHAIVRAVVAGAFIGWWFIHSDPKWAVIWP
jgi:hypothetical protein